MTSPAARGERFIATAGDFISAVDLARMLKEGLGSAARRVPTRRLPNWAMRLVGLFDGEVGSVLPELGKRKNASCEKARALLGWAPRSPREAILATARSLLDLGLVKAN